MPTTFGTTSGAPAGYMSNADRLAQGLRPKYDPWDEAFLGGEDTLRGISHDITGQENARYQQGLGTLTDAYRSSQAAMQPIDSALLFSKLADSVGARSAGALNSLRTSLGARGISPNSGAASGLMERLAFQNQNAIVGGTRDIAIENQKERQTMAAQNFANALNLAGYTNSPVSGVNLDTETSIFEGLLARRGIESAQKSQKRAARQDTINGLIGLGGGLAKGLLGAA